MQHSVLHNIRCQQNREIKARLTLLLPRLSFLAAAFHSLMTSSWLSGSCTTGSNTSSLTTSGMSFMATRILEAFRRASTSSFENLTTVLSRYICYLAIERITKDDVQAKKVGDKQDEEKKNENEKSIHFDRIGNWEN